MTPSRLMKVETMILRISSLRWGLAKPARGNLQARLSFCNKKNCNPCPVRASGQNIFSSLVCFPLLFSVLARFSN
jgi:hypothetical protein